VLVALRRTSALRPGKDAFRPRGSFVVASLILAVSAVCNSNSVFAPDCVQDDGKLARHSNRRALPADARRKTYTSRTAVGSCVSAARPHL
jgi:hypothetical protein